MRYSGPTTGTDGPLALAVNDLAIAKPASQSLKRPLARYESDERSGHGTEKVRGRPTASISMNDVTQILAAIQQGDAQAAERLLPLVYDELRELAKQRLARENPGQTLQPTALVHEAYLRL